MAGGLRFAVVIAHDGGDDGAVTAKETGNVAVQRQIFSVLVVTVVADGVADVMQKGASFKQHAVLRGKMMYGLQMVEKKNAEFTDMLGVGLVAIQTARESSSAGNHLAGGGVIVMRFLSRECVVGDFLQNAFAKADGGNGHAADIQIAAKGQERDGGDAHDVSTVAAHRVSLHALADIALE